MADSTSSSEVRTTLQEIPAVPSSASFQSLNTQSSLFVNASTTVPYARSASVRTTDTSLSENPTPSGSMLVNVGASRISSMSSRVSERVQPSSSMIVNHASSGSMDSSKSEKYMPSPSMVVNVEASPSMHSKLSADSASSDVSGASLYVNAAASRKNLPHVSETDADTAADSQISGGTNATHGSGVALRQFDSLNVELRSESFVEGRDMEVPGVITEVGADAGSPTSVGDGAGASGTRGVDSHTVASESSETVQGTSSLLVATSYTQAAVEPLSPKTVKSGNSNGTLRLLHQAVPLDLRDQTELDRVQLLEEDYMLPLGCVYKGLKQATRERAVKRSLADFALTFIFVMINMLANPVPSVFEIQDAISLSLARAPIGASGLRSKSDFYAIKNYEEFWSWTSTVLYPRVYNSVPNFTMSSRSTNFTIARYNKLITPIRFRQVKLNSDQCSNPVGNHQLSRPCWSSFRWPNLGILSGFGDMEVEEAESTSYSTGGHVVDLELDPVLALTKLSGMVNERWTDEGTQVVAVDVNTYNPNYNIATVFRFTVSRTIGGKLLPNVETCSCRLDVYSDLVSSLVSLEGFWAIMFLFYAGLRVFSLCYAGIRRSFCKASTLFELLHILYFFGIIALWVSHGLKDLSVFQSRHLTEFKDLYSTCHGFNVAHKLSGLSMVLACMQMVGTLKVYPFFSTVGRILHHSVKMVIPFTVVVTICIVVFCFSAMWLFGSRVEGLQTWYHAFGVLSHSLASGKHNLYIYDKMSDVNASAAGTWMVAWIIISAFVFFNMSVSLLTSAVFTISKQIPHEQKLELAFPSASFLTYLRARVLCLWKDPDTLEPIRRLLIEVHLWNAHLHYVDVDQLQSLMNTLVARGEVLLRIEDVMELFPHKDEEMSYKKAATWIRSLSACLGVTPQDAGQQRSMLYEADFLTQGVSKLEEEICGLSLQLRRVLPGATKARVI